MKVVGVIPARGGSKRIPRKNLAACGGKPLLAWSAEAARGAARLTRTILSTDDEEIAAAGRSLQIEVPFLRPGNLAGDRASMIPVLQHSIGWLCDNGGVDILVLLQPSSPLRTAKHIDDAVALYLDRKARSVVSVVEPSPRFNPIKLLSEQDGRLKPFSESDYRPGRSEAVSLPKVYARNGPAIVISRADDVMAGELYAAPSLPFVMAEEESVDIDTPFDLAMADWLLRRRERSAQAGVQL